MASKKIFQGLPAWSQGIISIAIVGGVGFIAYKLYKTYQESKALESSTEENKATRTDVTPLTSDARINEIARMLAGDILTDEARQAAIRLMN